MSTQPPESDKPVNESLADSQSLQPSLVQPPSIETPAVETATAGHSVTENSGPADSAETAENESSIEVPIGQPPPPASPTKLRRRQLFIGASVLVIGGIAAGLPFYKATAPGPNTEPPLTDAERFAELYQALKKSPDTTCRCDALLIDDAMLRSLTDIGKLTSLHVRVEGLTVQAASQLGAMPNLEELHLRGSQVDDGMLRAIAHSQSLRVLNLPSCVISPEAIESLRSMPKLKNLRLGIKQGTNQHARAVATISRLRAVHLIGVAVTDEGLQSLAEMRSLESLYLDDSSVTEAGWLWLFENYPELHIHIDQLHHDRDPQKHKH